MFPGLDSVDRGVQYFWNLLRCSVQWISLTSSHSQTAIVIRQILDLVLQKWSRKSFKPGADMVQLYHFSMEYCSIIVSRCIQVLYWGIWLSWSEFYQRLWQRFQSNRCCLKTVLSRAKWRKSTFFTFSHCTTIMRKTFLLKFPIWILKPKTFFECFIVCKQNLSFFFGRTKQFHDANHLRKPELISWFHAWEEKESRKFCQWVSDTNRTDTVKKELLRKFIFILPTTCLKEIPTCLPATIQLVLPKIKAANDWLWGRGDVRAPLQLRGGLGGDSGAVCFPVVVVRGWRWWRLRLSGRS